MLLHCSVFSISLFRRAGWSVVLCLGCADRPVAIDETTSDTGSDDEVADSESDSDGSEPDLPPAQPSCPAQLGEVVTCECGLVEDCVIDDHDSTGCTFACEDVPSPCPTVNCNHDSSTEEHECKRDVDADALQCVFDALAEGQPMQWSTHLIDTYWAGPALHESHTYLRLDETTYVVERIHYVNPHSGREGEDDWFFSGRDIAVEALIGCAAAATDVERFNCLHELSSAGELCADPSTLICP
jgi:hypothetical protein